MWSFADPSPELAAEPKAAYMYQMNRNDITFIWDADVKLKSCTGLVLFAVGFMAKLEKQDNEQNCDA